MPVARPEFALCLGGASCVWDDVLAWEAMYGKQWDGWVIAANDIGCHWPRDLHHWVSLHPNKLPNWKEQRRLHDLPMDGIVTWGKPVRGHEPYTDNTLEAWGGGSSGMLTVQVALELQCTRIVLCGIPITPTAHFQETQERFGPQWAAAAGHWRAWGRNKHLMPNVRSMSGRTQELLGAPTLEWLLS